MKSLISFQRNMYLKIKLWLCLRLRNMFWYKLLELTNYLMKYDKLSLITMINWRTNDLLWISLRDTMTQFLGLIFLIFFCYFIVLFLKLLLQQRTLSSSHSGLWIIIRFLFSVKRDTMTMRWRRLRKYLRYISQNIYLFYSYLSIYSVTFAFNT